MPFQVGPYDIDKAVATLPHRGVWCARADLVGGKAPAQGERVTVLLGNLQLVGTVRLSDVHVSRAEVLVIGGADGWRRTVKRRHYGGVRVEVAARDLCNDAGERLAPIGAVGKVQLGYGWTRPEGLASIALDEIGQPWHMRLDGLTHVGPRTVVSISGARFAVDTFRRSIRRAVLMSPTDELSLFLPGTTLQGEGLPAITIRSTRLVITDRQASAEVETT